MTRIFLLLLIVLLAGLFPSRAYMMSSAHYQINADSINFGGGKETSASYKSQDTAGESATGNSTSTHYKMSAGYQAMWDYPPGMAFSVDGNSAQLGTLSTLSASTASTGFTVSTNAVNGYVVQISGNTLTSDVGTDNIDSLAAPTASIPGSEQFGINLVDNSTPNVGTNPVGGQGTAASDYNTANEFKFVSGDTIAGCSTYSTNTAFTISYLGNISAVTAAGNYQTNLTLVATAKF